MNLVQGFALAGHQVNSITPEIDWTPDILPYRGKVSAVCRTKQDAADLVRYFGHEDFMPVLPILLCIPGGWGQMAGMGLATAAELRDECVARWELQEARLHRTGRTFDFDEAREKAGLPRSEDMDWMMRERAQDMVRHHKASVVTDPGNNLVYPRWAGKTVHAVATEWKDSND